MVVVLTVSDNALTASVALIEGVVTGIEAIEGVVTRATVTDASA